MRFLYTEHHHEDDDAVEISTSSIFVFCFISSLCCMVGLLCFLYKKYNNRVIVEITDDVIVIMEDAPKVLKNHTYDETTQYIPEICIICIDNYEDENIITTLSCNHSFHTECLKEWLKKKKECPYCKNPI